MKLTFIVDQSYDTNFVLPMLEITPFGQLEIKAKEWRVKLDLLRKIKEGRIESTDAEKRIQRISDQRYEKLLSFLSQTKDWYQQSWDEINDEFFENVEEITDHSWKHQNYECVVSLFHRGISNWGGNKIVRWWRESPYQQRRITAHELLISHYFTIIRDFSPKENLTGNQIWQLAEIAAFAITGLEEKLTRFWPWDQSGYYSNHNYPNLVKLQLKLKEPFLKRKDFNEYIKAGIEEIKKGNYSNITRPR